MNQLGNILRGGGMGVSSGPPGSVSERMLHMSTGTHICHGIHSAKWGDLGFHVRRADMFCGVGLQPDR